MEFLPFMVKTAFDIMFIWSYKEINALQQADSTFMRANKAEVSQNSTC